MLVPSWQSLAPRQRDSVSPLPIQPRRVHACNPDAVVATDPSSVMLFHPATGHQGPNRAGRVRSDGQGAIGRAAGEESGGQGAIGRARAARVGSSWLKDAAHGPITRL
jgi:hypothetical protein